MAVGDVVGTLKGKAHEEALERSQLAGSCRQTIVDLAQTRADALRNMWDLIEENCPLDREKRTYRYDTQTGDVIDAGPRWEGLRGLHDEDEESV